jgi:ubiquinone/menaquinone biosynthesis C-methylase UbiE
MPEMGSMAKAFCTSAPYQALARRVLLPRALQGVQPHGEVLEIGTGSGAMAAQLLKAHPDVRMVATDYDPDMVSAAAANLAPFGDRARVERADATALPFEDGRFDLVLTFTMLHHVLKWEDALREAVRVLRPGGRLVGYDLLDSPVFRLMHHREHSEVRMIRPVELDAVLGQVPLTDVEIRRTMLGLIVKFRATRA